MTRTLELFFARKLAFEVTISAPRRGKMFAGTRRSIRADSWTARVYLGLHFRFADLAARTLAKRG